MRTLCDVCESAAAILFCAADEASLCRACDDKVHTCNKLASRHVRVAVAEPSEVPPCDIRENAHGLLLCIYLFLPSSFLKGGFKNTFFHCEVDRTSLCLQSDMIVHVGGKRTHGRYLLLGQGVEFPGDKFENGSMDEPGSQKLNLGEPTREPPISTHGGNGTYQDNWVSALENDGKTENVFIDLNARPQRMCGQAPRNQQFNTFCFQTVFAME